MTDIIWRTPADVKTFMGKIKKGDIIFLVVNKDESYETILVFTENGSAWTDAPLGSFSCKEFNPHDYNMLAVVVIQEEQETSKQ